MIASDAIRSIHMIVRRPMRFYVDTSKEVGDVDHLRGFNPLSRHQLTSQILGFLNDRPIGVC